MKRSEDIVLVLRVLVCGICCMLCLLAVLVDVRKVELSRSEFRGMVWESLIEVRAVLTGEQSL